ncbi:MAG: DUF1778 domain-containing protein [Pseudomonadota bacterium]
MVTSWATGVFRGTIGAPISGTRSGNPNKVRDPIESARPIGTDFILDAARRAAEDPLLDQSLISVGPKAYAEFIERLDAPAKPNARLRRTMKQPLSWKVG